MGTRWAAAGITVDPRLEDGDAGGSQWAGVALAACELHGAVMSTPGLWAPAGIACHRVIAGPTMEAGLREALVHIFLTCEAFRRDQAKAQDCPGPEPQAQPSASMPLVMGTSVAINQTSSQRVSPDLLDPLPLCV